jgi:hypothetical protein
VPSPGRDLPGDAGSLVLLPPCKRQRPFAIAGALQLVPALVRPPQRDAVVKSPGGLPWRSQPRRFDFLIEG